MKLDYHDYKAWYEDELNHSERLNSRMGGHLTLLTALGAIIVFIWTQFRPYYHDAIFIILCILPTILFIVCCIMFAITYIGRKYAFIDIVSVLKDLDNIDSIEIENSEYSEIIDAKREELIKEYYVRPTIENRSYNANKSHIQHLTVICFLITYALSMLPVIYWLFRYYVNSYQSISYIILL